MTALFSAALVAPLTYCTGALADTQVVYPVADAFVSSAYPSSNFGGSTLKVRGTPTVRSYVRFDLQLPAGANISEAALELYKTSGGSAEFRVSGVADNSWLESGITYSNAPPTQAQLGASGGTSGTGYKTVTLPAGSLATGLNSFAATTTGSYSLSFHSREGAYQPRLVVTYGVLAPPPPPPPPPPPLSPVTPVRGPAVPSSGAYFGAHVNPNTADGPTRQEVLDLEAAIGRKLAVHHIYRGWTDSSFPYRSATKPDETWAVASGRIPLISHGDGSYTGSLNILDAINNGSQDALIQAAAKRIRDFGHPLFYRLFWEMNGSWESYNEKNASTPGTHDGTQKYVRAWRRVHDIFQQEGATNAAFVWCPNAIDSPQTPTNHWALYYPGDAYVDWVCADGYNRGTVQPWSEWRTFEALFSGIHADYPQKPFMVGETSSVEQGGDKARWIQDAAAYIKSHPGIKAFVWFDREPTTGQLEDWRPDTSPSSLDAYRAMGLDAYFNP